MDARCRVSILLIVFICWRAEALRTGQASRQRSRHVFSELKSNPSRTSSFVINSPAKERRLSFLNHQLSLLGGKVGPESRISSKIFSHAVDSDAGTDEISVVDVPQNTDVVVGKEIPKGTRILLECQAEFPVNWIYKGDGVSFMTRETIHIF